MNGKQVYLRRRCPHREPGWAVIEAESETCLAHGYNGLQNAMRWAHEHGYALWLSDDQIAWLEARDEDWPS